MSNDRLRILIKNLAESHMAFDLAWLFKTILGTIRAEIDVF